jgi:hypothetical protein
MDDAHIRKGFVYQISVLHGRGKEKSDGDIIWNTDM